MKTYTHKQDYLKLQEKYLANRDDESTLGAMLLIIMEVSHNFTQDRCKKIGLHLTKERKEDIDMLVVERILKRYRTKPLWYVKTNVIGSIFFDWRKVFLYKSNVADERQEREDSYISLEALLELNEEDI